MGRLVADDECERSLLENRIRFEFCEPRQNGKLWRLLALSLTLNAAFAMFLLTPIFRSERAVPRLPTDFASLPSAIRRFRLSAWDHKLVYNSSANTLSQEISPTRTRYFGQLSPEMDAVWRNLLSGQFIGISDPEAEANPELVFTEADRGSPGGYFHITLGVMHSLHCLNTVRKTLDKQYYEFYQDSQSPTDNLEHKLFTNETRRVYLEYCLDHLRQSLQCRPDLSPIALRKHIMPDGEAFWLGNASRHTCQDWGELKRWLDKRRFSMYGSWL